MTGMAHVKPDTWAAHRLITNDTGITPTGTYATSNYYNTDYGVKVGYMKNGSLLLSMKAGSSTSYKQFYFSLSSAPQGVSITEAHTPSSDYIGIAPYLIYACMINGLKTPSSVSISMAVVDTSLLYVRVDITITEA